MGKKRELTDDEIEANKKIASTGRRVADYAAKLSNPAEAKEAKPIGATADRAAKRAAAGKTLRGRRA